MNINSWKNRSRWITSRWQEIGTVRSVLNFLNLTQEVYTSGDSSNSLPGTHNGVFYMVVDAGMWQRKRCGIPLWISRFVCVCFIEDCDIDVCCIVFYYEPWYRYGVRVCDNILLKNILKKKYKHIKKIFKKTKMSKWRIIFWKTSKKSSKKISSKNPNISKWRIIFWGKKNIDTSKTQNPNVI